MCKKVIQHKTVNNLSQGETTSRKQEDRRGSTLKKTLTITMLCMPMLFTDDGQPSQPSLCKLSFLFEI